ncbi:hypothetical protein BGW41_005225, partial [Actinomortierella wolfii]
YLEAEAYEKIWKVRCSATVEWEKTIGITAKAKTEKDPTARDNPWLNGYGFHYDTDKCYCGDPHDHSTPCPDICDPPQKATDHTQVTVSVGL